MLAPGADTTSKSPQLAATSLSTVSIVRTPKGVLLSGFSNDFINQSIKTTMKFPQTQAVIKLAVGKAILQTLIEQREQQILETYHDLQIEGNEILDLNRIKTFVGSLYQKMGLNIHQISTQALSEQFQYQIREALKNIVHWAFRYGQENDKNSAQRAINCLEEKSDDNPYPQIEPALNSLNLVSLKLKQQLKEMLDAAVTEMLLHPEGPALRSFLIDGLKTKQRSEWKMGVIMPYGMRVTKLAMSAEGRNAARIFEQTS